MATISTLAVNLIARTGVFDRKMRQSKRTTRNFASGVAAANKRMMGLAKGVLLAAGIGGLGYLIKRTMDSIDATAKLADRIGTTTEHLTALQHAAELGGAGTQALNKSFEMMVRRLGEARAGIGEAKNTLELLGLSADRLARQDPAKTFETLAKAIDKLPTAADRAKASADLFGRSGTVLLNTMRDLADKGLAAVVKEAEKLGLTFSQIDADKVQQANRCDDAIKERTGRSHADADH